jgi:hypothetical protein
MICKININLGPTILSFDSSLIFGLSTEASLYTGYVILNGKIILNVHLKMK